MAMIITMLSLSGHIESNGDYIFFSTRNAGDKILVRQDGRKHKKKTPYAKQSSEDSNVIVASQRPRKHQITQPDSFLASE
jgi:hypothetical protein